MAACDIPMSKEESRPGYLRREELVGKLVVSIDASIVGTVDDIVATTDGKIGLRVAMKHESDQADKTIVESENIQAMGDVVLLRSAGDRKSLNIIKQPSPPPAPVPIVTRTCSRCGFVNGSNSRFCIKCGLRLD